MTLVPIHAGPNLPLSPRLAVTILGVGAVVFFLVLFDIYRREVGGWP
ncbi:hypothetical protein [Halobellus rubicundus]|uniref:ABC transporter permease n=1 Tax=Halobellus rubicundus TaxID=2996466 RepID=A0ABD5MAH9_9EURY